ncbi:hypothetical protein BBJ28_00010207 [Nothophytophthora sp. Chile5]|nr:hypothetical protein BBJ28_00010207 [Nothophytophthora sp. Chile5]
MEETHAPVVAQDLLENGAAMAPYDAANAATWDACAAHKTCDSCLNASYACHFCASDFQCHAIGSVHGCITGISTCHHLQDCERADPQYVGYGPPPSVVIAVLCLVVTLTCCICGISSICSVFCRQRKPPSRRAELTAALAANKRSRDKKKMPTLRYITLISQEDEDRMQAQAQPLLLDNIREDEVGMFDEVDHASLERLRSRYERDERQFSWRSFGVRTLWLTSLVTTTVLALMFYPRIPDYNVCNREFEWESILHSLMSLEPKIEYQVLVSVINENRFGFVLESGRADIYHNTTLVGKWELEKEWEAAAGAISDVIAGIHIEPGYSEALSLWSAFSKNELIFRINASVTGSITWGTHKVRSTSLALLALAAVGGTARLKLA